MNDFRLTRNERLRAYGRIRRLFESGKGGFVYPFRYIVYAEPLEVLTVSVLFSVPKRFHKRANRRNTLRRRMREAYRLNSQLAASTQQSGEVELALIYSTKEVCDYKTIENAIKRILCRVAESL